VTKVQTKLADKLIKILILMYLPVKALHTWNF